jgi:DNA-binding response OmpR family regulator
MSQAGRVAGGAESLKILVVDDEPAMVGALGALLGQAGHRIVAAYDGDEALRRFRDDAPDLVLLDLAMPGLDGATVCRRIREVADTPIVVVSGERDRAATVELLDLGADDYIRKPFRADELLARVRAVARRAALARPAGGGGGGPRASGSDRGWELDRRRHEIRWQGTVVPATVTEFRLLRQLVERLGEVVSHDDLLTAGWPDVPDPDPLWLKPHLARLREKLVGVGAPVPVAVRGVGYMLEDLPDEVMPGEDQATA